MRSSERRGSALKGLCRVMNNDVSAGRDDAAPRQVRTFHCFRDAVVALHMDGHAAGIVQLQPDLMRNAERETAREGAFRRERLLQPAPYRVAERGGSEQDSADFPRRDRWLPQRGEDTDQ